MDLSFNKINEVKQSNVSFKGIKGALDASNRATFQFTPPPHRSDEKVILEVAQLELDPKTGLYIPPKEQDFSYIALDDDQPTERLQEALGQNQSFAYRYKITSQSGNVRYYADESQTIDAADGKGKLNVINQGSRFNYGVSPKGGNMYHGFVDSNLFLKQPGDKQPVEARNHFNKIGGTIKDIIGLLKKTDVFDSFTYLMLNPDIGADRISSHKYWPENQYQCTNLDDFKELNVELFKQGKSYVADGAFTSQGLNSPMVQHVFKWGEASPFSKMLKIDGRFCPGVIPDKSVNDKVNAFDHIGVRLVNAEGSEGYNKNKPTYIQFYDDRLLSKKKQDDTKNLQFDYDKEPDDHYDIVKHEDSVLPIPFEIDPKDPKIKEVFKNGANKVLLKDIEDLDRFLKFSNATITYKNTSAGATNWDGNVDIIKMNTSNPAKGTEEGCTAAREYLFGVATYWTETVQKTLLKETALMSDNEKEKVAKNNGISDKQYQELKAAIKNNTFTSRILDQNATVEKYVKEFPLQSIETAPELGAVFSEPQFNAEFLAAKTGSTTVEERLNTLVNSVIDSAIPDKYKGNAQYRAYAVKTFGQDIIKEALASAMKSEASKKDKKLKDLKDVNIKILEQHPSKNPTDERAQIVSAVARGLESADVKDIQSSVAKNLKKISLDDFKMSESIVLQGKGGLNWRFDAAKDIGDLDSIRNKTADFRNIWNNEQYGVLPFWREFIQNIREHNPSSYVINEITELAEFYDWNDDMSKRIESIRKYGGDKAVEEFLSLTPEEQKNYKLNIAYQTEKRYLAETNSTTTSMFDEGFNRFTKFIGGVNPETGGNADKTGGSIREIMKQMKELQKYSQPNNSIFAHLFTHNHDKPTILHTLPLDMALFYKGDMSYYANPFYNYVTKNVTGNGDDKLADVSSKSVAVGWMLKQGIKKYVDPQYHDALFKAIENLSNGRRENGNRIDFNRAEAFGTLPYEISLKDIIHDAGLDGKINPIELQFYILEDAREQQMAMTRTSNAIPGVYTWFNGAEFGQTGFETKNKNVHVSNRNKILRELKDNPLFAPYYKETQANLGLYKTQGMSALKGGFSRSLNIQTTKLETENESQIRNPKNYERFKEAIVRFVDSTTCWPKGDACQIPPKMIFEILDDTIDSNPQEFKNLLTKGLHLNENEIDAFKNEYDALKHYFTEADDFELEMAPVYAYDEKGSRTLVIATNNGLPLTKTSSEYDGVDNDGKPRKISINYTIKPEKLEYEFASISLLDKETGTTPLEDGTILKRKVYDEQSGKYVDEKCEYIVHNGELMKKSAVGKAELDDDDFIVIDDTTAAFYAPREGQKHKYMSALYNGTK